MNQVVPASANLEGRGASYYLPRTIVVATIPVSATKVEPGEFADYSLPLLRINPEVRETLFALGDEMTFDLAGERDPKARFIAIDPRGPFKTFSRTMNLNEQGVLTKGDAWVENKTVEFAVSTLEAAAKIAGSMIKPAGGKAELFPDRAGLKELRVHVNSLDKAVLGYELTLEGLRAGLNVLLATNPDHYLEDLKKQDALKPAPMNWEDFTQHRPKGLGEMVRATDAYNRIGALADKIEKAWPTADRAALQNERDGLLAKFTGKKSEKKTWTGQFRWVPTSRNPGDISGTIDEEKTLFVLSEHTGVTSFNVKPEVPPSFLLSASSAGKKNAAEEGKDKLFSVALACHSIIPAETGTWENLLREPRKHGWHYRIPAQARISLRVNGVVRASRRTYIGQHGCVGFVPATSGGQKVTSTIELDPITGALKSTVHGGQAFDPGLVSRTGAAVAGVIDAEKSQQKAEAAANDPLNQLDRKKKLLQLKKDIEALEKPTTP